MASRYIISGKNVALSSDITDLLDNGRYLQLIQKGNGHLVKDIDFSREVVRESFNTCPYEFLWHTSIPTEGANQLICLFPNHKDRNSERKQVLRVNSFWSLSSLNKQINKRFEASLEHTDGASGTKFAVCYGKHVYICVGISGTIYLLWARHINRTNNGNVPNTLFHDVPVIVNMTGAARVRGIYILREEILEDADLLRIPITAESPTFLQNGNVDLFVCEVRDSALPPEPATGPFGDTLRQKGYTLLTKRAALARVLAPTQQLQKHQQGSGDADEVSADWEQNAYLDLQLNHIQNTN